MKLSNISPRIILFCSIIMILVNLIGNFVSALCIYNNVISFETSDVVGPLALVCSAFIGSMAGMKMTGNQMTGYSSGAVVVIAFTIAALLLGWENTGIGMLTKTSVAIFVGSLLGNFIGKIKYKTLGNTKKKNRIHTK